MVQIKVLGAVRAVSEGRELHLGGPKRRAVLAVLAMAAPRACSSDQLVDGLWGQDPPESVRNALQVSVTSLRKVLRPCGVEIERVGDGYALRGPFRVDAAGFEQAVAEGRAALRAGDVARSVGLLAAAVDLWEGRALDGLDALPFTGPARVGLESTRCAALVDLAEAQLRFGDPQAAVKVGQVLLAQHPFDERGWIALATAQYWSGRQDLALDACRRAREVLIEGLGVDPTNALADVEGQILNHSLPDRRQVTAEHDSDPVDASLPDLPEPFVGRQDLVDEVVRRVEHGQRLISLLGMGGIGKTTVAVAAAHQLAAAGRRVVFCPLETETDALSAAELVCRLAGVDPGGDPVQALIESGDLDVLVLDNAEQVAGFGAVVDRLVRAGRPVTVLATSRRTLGARVEQAISVPPLSLAPAAAAPSPAEQLFLSHAERIRPGISAGNAQPVRDLCAMMDGIPLALELAAGRTRTLTPKQLLTRIQTRRESMLGGSTDMGGVDRQASLWVVLRDSFHALGGSGQRLFELFGSLEGWVSLELLERASDGWVDDFSDALDELVASGLVALDLDGRASMRVPIREYAATLGPRDHLDHRVVAEALAQVQVASTGLFGSDAPVALRALRRDEDTALVGLATAVGAGDAASAAALAIGLNRYWLLTGRLTEGRRWLARVSDLVGHTPADAAALGILTGTFASYVNDPGTAQVLGAALASAQTSALPVGRLVVNGWCCLAAFAAHHGDFVTAESAASTAGRLASSSGDAHLVALARDIDGHIASYRGDHQRAFDTKLAGIADARRSGDLYDLINLLMTSASDLLYLDRPAEAIAFADEAFDRTVTLDVGPLLGGILLVRGSALLAGGQVASARGNLLEALRIARDHYPDTLATADILYTLGACTTQQFDDAEACRCFGAGQALYTDHGISALERLAKPIRDARDRLEARLGPATFSSLCSLGAADPERTVSRLLDDQVVG